MPCGRAKGRGPPASESRHAAPTPADGEATFATVDPLAIYAAVVGTVGLGWQIWRETRRTRTNIRVELEHAAMPREFYVAFTGDPDQRSGPVEYVVSVIVVNDGESTEYVRDIWLENRARTRGYDFGHDGEHDGELLPRGRIATSASPRTRLRSFGWP